MPHPQPNPQFLLETNPKHYPKKNLFIQKGLWIFSFFLLGFYS